MCSNCNGALVIRTFFLPSVAVDLSAPSLCTRSEMMGSNIWLPQPAVLPRSQLNVTSCSVLQADQTRSVSLSSVTAVSVSKGVQCDICSELQPYKLISSVSQLVSLSQALSVQCSVSSAQQGRTALVLLCNKVLAAHIQTMLAHR